MKALLRPLALLALFSGLVLCMGSFTFLYGEGYSYALKDPKACMNCHVMNHQYESWLHSGHHHVATCNDCHLATGMFSKWISKARNGWNHSLAFTLDNYEKPIKIKPFNLEILQDNCVRCHQTLVTDAILIPSGGSNQAQSCIHCHRGIGHMPLQ